MLTEEQIRNWKEELWQHWKVIEDAIKELRNTQKELLLQVALTGAKGPLTFEDLEYRHKLLWKYQRSIVLQADTLDFILSGRDVDIPSLVVVDNSLMLLLERVSIDKQNVPPQDNPK